MITLRLSLQTSLLIAASLPSYAAGPRFHEAQTLMALSRLPTRLAQVLRSHQDVLLTAARGMPGSKVPTPEDVRDQFHKVLRLCEEGKPQERLVREMGILANQVQLLTDPSCLEGLSQLRTHFQKFGEEMLPMLVLTDEPYWPLTGPAEPGPRLEDLARKRAERFALLDATFDEQTGKRLVPWDKLSVPFAMLQLGYSTGVHATANMWIMIYRVTGSSWTVS